MLHNMLNTISVTRKILTKLFAVTTLQSDFYEFVFYLLLYLLI